jgi:hypothetical protein
MRYASSGYNRTNILKNLNFKEIIVMLVQKVIMRLALLSLSISIAVVGFGTSPAHAWDDVGHQVVARIAWDNLTPNAQKNVIFALKKAPADSTLLDVLKSVAGQPRTLQDRVLFTLASNWADKVKRGGKLSKYNHPEWHFVDQFFSQPDPNVPGQPVPNMPPSPNDNVAAILVELQSVLGLAGAPKPTTTFVQDAKVPRALQIAWLLHLVGDIHQPLHTSTRETSAPGEATGDRGGNLFLLDAKDRNLHAYWDGLIARNIVKPTGQTEDSYIGQIAQAIEQDFPLTSLQTKVDEKDIQEWSKEGFQTTIASVYDPTVMRGQTPPTAYKVQALAIARMKIALGGYRLANCINRLFDTPSLQSKGRQF